MYRGINGTPFALLPEPPPPAATSFSADRPALPLSLSRTSGQLQPLSFARASFLRVLLLVRLLPCRLSNSVSLLASASDLRVSLWPRTFLCLSIICMYARGPRACISLCTRLSVFLAARLALPLTVLRLTYLRPPAATPLRELHRPPSYSPLPSTRPRSAPEQPSIRRSLGVYRQDERPGRRWAGSARGRKGAGGKGRGGGVE